MTDAEPSHGSTDADGGLAIEGSRGLRDVRRFSHDAMATVFEVHLVHADARYASQAAQAAFDLLDGLERELSRFRTNSDITRINHLAAGENTQVSVSTIECLVIARHMFDLTGGAFDVSIGTGLPTLDLDADTFRVTATTTGVQLDLGGVGKGYAVDRMAELLEEWGIERALVHGGFSSVLALEPPPDAEGWPLTLSDPANPSRILARLRARQTALSASGLRKGEHILDPRSGVPAAGRLAAWSLVPRPDAARQTVPGDGPRFAAAAVADALTTGFMLMSSDEIQQLCDRSAGLEAWILRPRTEGIPEGISELMHFGGTSERANREPQSASE